MKKIFTLLLVTLSFLTFAQTSKIDTQKSQLTWKGHKVVGFHEGTINFESGQLIFKKKELIGGEFIVDMNSISTTDISGKGKERLDAHLKNEDFFNTTQFPKSTLVFKKIQKTAKDTYKITADLTIKEITNPVEFILNIDGKSAKSSFEIDRTKFDIKYRSGSIFPELADKAIKDNFELNVSLVF